MSPPSGVEHFGGIAIVFDVRWIAWVIGGVKDDAVDEGAGGA